ncbi:MAG: GNAT family N-acetyltransferase [Halofilum sp. (in: g-proteobacteria)]|nr:GNAT family N-acetyltransferase [Halofilum sp. (in: g-proteobacteria)]
MNAQQDRDRLMDRASGSYRSLVTYLEMHRPPAGGTPEPPRAGVRVERWTGPAVEDYVALFRRVGEPWLWHGRLEHGRDEIARIIAAPDYELWRLHDGHGVAGLGELDRSRPGEVEVMYFGLVPDRVGAGLGGFFLRSLVHAAWRDDVRRVWLHTCTEDHPGALGFYQHIGFHPYAEEVEWVHDPRLRGLLPRDAGPHVEIPE